ncbi:DUF5632 domain-containing protein [Mycolicibacterium mucogenicum]|uniref:DUF5632 domain-containing protein n=1 Tax=Mycolicibacterium mucogenicum TaxID=56689 RepID=UPI00226A3081|nr:DUF5632 domain-containing protein [Mycolicibacterium mucogenicum]MCX8559227.1 DUF5632 domain-containing protein [Mycolicibacterium mucogenicum]
MPDLPEGKWSALLVGPWWPAPPTALQSAAQHWTGQGEALSNAATDVKNLATQLGVNQGATADDVIGKHNTLENKVRNAGLDSLSKSRETEKVASAIDGLRTRLTGIAARGNTKIDNILSKKGPLAEKLIEVNNVIFEANTSAMNASGDAMNGITTSLNRILQELGIGGSAEEWLAAHGAGAGGNPPRTQPLTEADLQNALSGKPGGGARDASTSSEHPATADGVPGTAGRDTKAPPVTPVSNQTPSGAPGTAGRDESPSPQGVPSPAAPAVPLGAPTGGGGTHLPGVGGGHVPGGGGVPGGIPGGLSPAALGTGLSPASLSHSFESGLQAGQPAAAGAQSLAGGAVHAAAAPPQAPLAAPTMASSGVESMPGGHAAPAAVPAASSADHYSAPLTVMAAPIGAPAAPFSGVPAAPVGPLPAYGADIRPVAALPPVAPTVSTGPVGGAPVAGSPVSSPAAGGGLVSPVAKSVPPPASAATGSSVPAGALAAATAGAVAGDEAKRQAEETDLAAKVTVVARQEPALAWAAGLRDDETTTLLTTNLAGGWIPPHVRLPAGVTLLAPAARRKDISATDLLGAVTVSSAYNPPGYIAAPRPDDPLLTGERARHGPRVDELGPTLVEAITRRSGLPVWVQGAAKAAARGTGVYEIDQLRRELEDVRSATINAYRERKPNLPQLVGNWMLLASIEAIVDDHEDVAHYHMAWYTASLATTGRR